ncbi:HAMP domain-containing protein [Bacillus lacus]|uniref:histidine kinase n=1 Tax=Metabacillus lacus TaxID=1983721 RepID=A0A7X2IZZ4_9BACI|nr:HAMP domain-containing protein [Metabacillus lacus]
MRTFRYKLLFYFLVFVALFNLVSFSIYYSSTRIVSEYHQSFQGFLLFNEISQQSGQIYEKVNAYIAERDPVFIDEFEEIKKEFLKNQEKLSGEEVSGVTAQSLQKYESMMVSLLEESEAAMEAVGKEDIDDYSYHLREVRTVSSYLQESTLTLLNLELSQYQLFYESMEKRNISFTFFTISLFTSTLLLAVFFALYFSRGVTKPIHQLSLAAKEVAAGNFDGPAIKVTSSDEINFLGKSFDLMRQNVKDLIAEIQQKSELDQLLKELELKHLQNQINPHFLFNTLNTISRMAYLEDARVTSRLIESVSALLRYNLRDLNKSVTLREEVDVVREYFYIQKTRFADRISFSSQVDESCLDVEIPSLTLQPLVENAFIHGVEHFEEGGKIGLEVKRDGSDVLISIIDNGEGMNRNIIDRLLNAEDESGVSEKHTGHSTSIGLKNVIRRIQLFYKKENLLNILSLKGQGTTVTIRIPGGEGE